MPRAWPAILWLFGSWGLGCPGCAGRSADPEPKAATVTVAETPSQRPIVVMRAYASAPGETLSLSPGSPLPDPTADFPSLEAAVDAVEALLRRTVDEADTAIRIRREVVTFQYWYSKSTAPGLAIQVTVTDTSRCPDFPLEAALLESGWVQADGYSADGADGSVLGLVSRRFLCVVQGQWDGGDDSDSTYVPAPGCQVSVTCVPRRADDVPPR